MVSIQSPDQLGRQFCPETRNPRSVLLSPPRTYQEPLSNNLIARLVSRIPVKPQRWSPRAPARSLLRPGFANPSGPCECTTCCPACEGIPKELGTDIAKTEWVQSLEPLLTAGIEVKAVAFKRLASLTQRVFVVFKEGTRLVEATNAGSPLT